MMQDTCSEVAVCGQERRGVTVLYSPIQLADGCVLACSGDKTVRVLDINAGKTVQARTVIPSVPSNACL